MGNNMGRRGRGAVGYPPYEAQAQSGNVNKEKGLKRH